MIIAFRLITRDSARGMIEASNSAAWYAREDTIRTGEYILCVRPQTREPFFIARIDRYEAVPESGQNRWAFFFREYAKIDGSLINLDEKSKNPFRRFDLESALKVPLESLNWEQVVERTRKWSFSDAEVASQIVGGLTIQEAKRQLAASLGVRADRIEITVRG
jgi:hypothetical protein